MEDEEEAEVGVECQGDEGRHVGCGEVGGEDGDGGALQRESGVGQEDVDLLIALSQVWCWMCSACMLVVVCLVSNACMLVVFSFVSRVCIVFTAFGLVLLDASYGFASLPSN
jgi:hypothetical protein